MRTITVDILNEKALNLLRALEQLKLIRLRTNTTAEEPSAAWITKYSGAMTKQSLEEIEKQINELRSEWV